MSKYLLIAASACGGLQGIMFGSDTGGSETVSPVIRCCCCCSHINSHDQVRGHRTGSSHSGAEEYARENTNNPRWYPHISQLTQFMPPPETYKSEIGSQSTMCQVHTGAYASLLAPGKTDVRGARSMALAQCTAVVQLGEAPNPPLHVYFCSGELPPGYHHT